MKRSTSFRLSEKARTKLVEQAENLGVSQTDIIEILIHQNSKVISDINRRTQALLDYQSTDDSRNTYYVRAWHCGFASGWYAAINRERDKN